VPYGGLADQFPGALNEVPYGKRRELPPVGIRRYGDYCGERLGSIVSVSSFSSDALYLNQGRC